MSNKIIKKIMLFLGYELVKVGYLGSDDETSWQIENEQWMNKMEIDAVGEYFVKIEDDDYIYLYLSDWSELIPIHKDWYWIMKCVEKIENLGFFCMINRWTSVYAGTKDKRISVTSVEGNTKILNTYKAILLFIEWFDNNNKNTQ